MRALPLSSSVNHSGASPALPPPFDPASSPTPTLGPAAAQNIVWALAALSSAAQYLAHPSSEPLGLGLLPPASTQQVTLAVQAAQSAPAVMSSSLESIVSSTSSAAASASSSAVSGVGAQPAYYKIVGIVLAILSGLFIGAASRDAAAPLARAPSSLRFPWRNLQDRALCSRRRCGLRTGLSRGSCRSWKSWGAVPAEPCGKMAASIHCCRPPPEAHPRPFGACAGSAQRPAQGWWSGRRGPPVPQKPDVRPTGGLPRPTGAPHADNGRTQVVDRHDAHGHRRNLQLRRVSLRLYGWICGWELISDCAAQLRVYGSAARNATGRPLRRRLVRPHLRARTKNSVLITISMF